MYLLSWEAIPILQYGLFTGVEMNACTLISVTRAVLLPLLLCSLCVISSPLRHGDYYPGDPSAVYTYDRFPEVERLCAPILPVLAELKPDDTRGEKIKNQLWFVNGDWNQEPDAMPLIPVNDEMGGSDFNSSTKLVSFWVMDVDSNRRSENMVSVSGILEIGFTNQRLPDWFSEKPYKWSPDFETGYGTKKLIITFEGVYVESHENGGERHMCLLGTSMMPNSDVSSSQVRPNDKIMLILKYPKTFSLTSRGIYGQMQNLATESNVKDFGKVSISSQLNARSSKYRFGSAQVLKACGPYKDSDIWFHGTSVIFQGKDLCNYLQRISWMATFIINPKQNSIVQDGELRSFVPQNRDFNFGNVRIVLRNFICHPGFYGINTANVSAEFAVTTSDKYLLNGPNPRDSTGLFGKSIFAEGIWSSSEKELCMVGCLNGAEKDSVVCDYRVSVFLPTAFNIHRRSTVYVTIKGVKALSESDDTVSFEAMVSTPTEFLNWADSYVAYDYSKLSLATALNSRHQFPSLVSTLRRTLFKYPSYNPNNHITLSFLADSLTVRSTSVLYSPRELDGSKSSEDSEVSKALYLDLLIGSQHVHVSPPADNQAFSDIRTVALHGYLSITGHYFSNVSLSVEGLYDPTSGTMHLIGCSDLRSSPIENTDTLEQGQDCMIEVVVEYPPTNVRWFLNQKLKISITSLRQKHDSLHFSPIVIRTNSIRYPWQLTMENFIRTYEECITIILLLHALIAITYQRKYMNIDHGEGYTSLVMIGIQLSSYLIAFVTDSDFMISSTGSNVYNNAVPSNSSTMQFLLLMTLMEFYILFRLVRHSRRSHLSQSNSATDIKVLIITFSIHVLGLSIFLSNYSAADLRITLMSLPVKELEAYCVLVLDFFLLPQIIANILRRPKSKPLRKIYYIGFSMIRAYPHLYTYCRDPVSDYVSAREGQSQTGRKVVASERFSDIAVTVVVILLAFVCYIQQRWWCIIPQQEPTAEPDHESLLDEHDVSNSN